MLSRLFAPKVKVSAHCDLPCGVYDPATGQKALDYIAQIDKIFWETKKA